MSAALLRDPCKEHTIADDLESFVHVLVWTTLRHVPLKMCHTKTRAQWNCLFDEHSFPTGEEKGDALAFGNSFLYELEFKRPSPLLQLLRTLSVTFIVIYHKDPLSILASTMSQSILELLKETTETPFSFARLIQASLGADSWPEDDGSSTLVPLDGSQD